MTSAYERVQKRNGGSLNHFSLDKLAPQRLSPDSGPPPPRVRNARRITEPLVARRWGILRSQTKATDRDQSVLMDPLTIETMEVYEKSIENFVGTINVPIGVAGPILVNGTFAKGHFYVPLATTEAALVASHHRGATLLTEAGGCSAATLAEGVSRSPAFILHDLREAMEFARWVSANVEAFRDIAGSTTRYGRLLDLQVHIAGNQVLLNFEYSTGDAAGQNMVTIATDAICRFICDSSPIRPRFCTLECNLAGDKKASAAPFLRVRGRKVTAEAVIARDLVARHLHSTPQGLVAVWRVGVSGSVMNGTIGVQSQYANGLAALYLATGQDVACVAESSVGITRFEVTEEGSLYVSVTLPNIIVGTVGGGTCLPTQQACLRIADSHGAGHAGAFAELCAAVCLAGELSLVGALSAGDLASAHRRLARGRNAAAD